MKNIAHEFTRRRFLRSTVGAALTVPWLESLVAADNPKAERPKRFVGLYHPNGNNPYKWFPNEAGPDYEMPETLALLKDVREEMTVFSGLAHFKTPQGAGHWGITNALTGYGNGAGKKYGNSISLDQFLAPHISSDTRFESLVLSRDQGVGSLGGGIRTMSITKLGTPIPAESSPARIFERLFVEPNATAKARVRDLHDKNQSILDDLVGESARLEKSLGKRDQEKLDEYLTNVRNVEKLMNKEADWLDVPRVQIDEATGKMMLAADRHDYDLMIELIYLALVSDTTRVITFVQMKEAGLYHATSHWNKNPEKLLPLLDVWDQKWVGGLAKLAGKLKATPEGDGNYLDRTAIVYCNGHGRKPHYSHDLPFLLLGGNDFGFKHGQHLAFAPIGEERNIRGNEKREDWIKRVGDHKKTPLANMFVSVAKAMGVPTEKFADSDGPLTGLMT